MKKSMETVFSGADASKKNILVDSQATVRRVSSLLSLSVFVSTNAALANAPASSHSFSSAATPSFSLHHNSVVQSTMPHAGLSHASNGAVTGSFAHSSVLNAHAVSPTVAGSNLNAHNTSVYNHLVNVFSLPQNNAATLQASTIDLSSSKATITLGATIFQGAANVAITVGGTTQVFHAGSLVTAAEYVAIRQILSGGAQTLTVSSAGVATGGSFSLNAVASPRVSELLVPVGVVAIDNVSTNKAINFGGELVNYGSIYGVATGSGAYSGVISAKDIINEVGGIITSQAPAGLTSSSQSTLSNIDLTLIATHNVVNSGTISSSGNLTLAVGGGIANSGMVTTNNGNINLLSANNSGAFNINGNGGIFNAGNNNINIGALNPGNGTALAIVMNGGNYLSQNLNVDAGTGSVTGAVGQLTGVLNTTANAAHLLTDTKTLHLGQNTIDGDPTYVNAGGDIVINGAVTAAEDLTIVAAGNITASGNAYLSTANATGASSVPNTDITLIAGANVSVLGTGTGGVNSPTPTNISSITALNNSQTVSLFMAPGGNGSGSGGNIDLTGSTHSGPVIDTSSNLASGSNNQVNGGNVTLAALGINSNTGYISLPSGATAITTGSANANGGNVLIMAGAAPTTASATIKSGDINTTGGTASGSVGIYTAEPTTNTSNQTVVYGIDGSVSSGNYLTFTNVQGVPTLQANAQVQVGNIITSGANGASGAGAGPGATASNGGNGGNAGAITIAAGSNILTGNLNASGGGGGGGGAAGANGTGGNGGNGGNAAAVSISSTAGTVQVNGDIVAAGGGGGGGGGSATSVNPSMGGAGGNAAGSTTASGITINAGGSLNVTGGIYDIAGSAGGNGGSVASGGAGGGGGASYGSGGGGGGGTGSAGGGAGGGGLDGGGGGGSGAAFGNGGSGGAGGGGNGGGAGGEAGTNGNGGDTGTTRNGGNGAQGASSPISGATGGSQGNPGAGGSNSGLPGPSGETLTAGATNTGNITAGAASITVGNDIDGYAVSLAGTSTQGGSGYINLGGFIKAGQNVNLSAAGSGNIIQASGKSILSGGTLTATTNSGDIASSAQNLMTNAPAVALSSAAGSLYVHDSGATLIASGGTAKVYSLTSDDYITYGTDVKTGKAVQITATNSINLTVTVQGDISQALGDNLLTAPIINLVTNQGNIGTVAHYINANSPTLVADTNANQGGNGIGTGSVFINDNTAALSITGTAASYALTDNVAGGVVVTVPSALVSSGLLSISNNAGSLSFTGAGKLYGGTALSLGSAGVLDLGGLYAVGKSAPNGAGATVTAIAGNNLVMSGNLGQVTIDTSSTNGTGGGVVLLAGDKFTLDGSTGNINFDVATASGGSVLFNAGTTVAINAGTTGSKGGDGGSVTVVAYNGTTKYSGVVLDNASINTVAANGNNGSVGIYGYGVNAVGQTIVIGDISAASARTDTQGFVYLTGTASGKVGSITAGKITSGQLISITTGGNIVYGAGTFTAALNVQSYGANVAVPESTVTADRDSGGSGGFIRIIGSTITWANSGTTPLTLDASATGSGNGGIIDLEITGTKGMVIGAAKGDYILNATGGSSTSTGGDGGTITVSSGGNLSIDPARMTAGPLGTGPAAGANYTLTAGSAAAGNLYVSGSLDASAKGNAAGGTLSLTSNNATAFTVDTTKAKTNGVLGTIAAGNTNGTSGSITISNNGGGITLDAPMTSIAFNQLSLSAGKTGAVTIATDIGSIGAATVDIRTVGGAVIDKANSISAQVVTINSKTGAVTATFIAPELAINTGGAVIAKSILGDPLTLDNSSGKTFSLTTNADVTTNVITAGSGVTITTLLNGSITLGGNIMGGTAAKNTLSAAGTGSINTTSSQIQINGGTLTLNSVSGGIGTTSSLTTNASTLSATSTSGGILVTDSNTAKVTLKALDTSATASITAAGAISDSAKTLRAEAVYLTTSGAVGGISVGAAVGGSTTKVVSLSVAGTGNITGTQLITAGDVTLASSGGSIGSLKVNAQTVSANTTGKAVTITDTSTSPVTLNSSSSGGALTFTAANGVTVTGASAGAGLLKIVATKGTLNVAGGAVIATTNGAITLEAADAKAGAIIIADGASITSMAAKAGGGTVTIAVGSASPAKVAGTAPANVTPSTVGTGKIYYGKNGVTAVGSNNSLTAKNTNLIFSTGNLPASAITIGSSTGGVIITADPPALSAPSIANTTLNMPAPPVVTAQSNVVSSTINSQNSSAILTATFTSQAASSGSTALASTGLTASQQATVQTPGSSASAPNGSVIQDVSYIDTDSRFGNYSGIVDASVNSGQDLGMSLGLGRAQGCNYADYDEASGDSVKHITLRSGNLLLAPTVNTKIENAFGTVELKAGSVVLVMALPQGLAVYDLHDGQRGAVILHSGNKIFALTPGKHALIASDTVHAFEEINPAELIGYGEIANTTVAQGLQAFTGDFSLPSAIVSVRPLAQLTASKHAGARALAGSVLKTAAILMQIKGGTSYERKVRAVMTAMR